MGVAAFERVAPEGVQLPDVATLLVDRLTAGLGEAVVGPAQLGAPPAARPSPQQLRSWAGAAGVSSVVTGRATQLGRSVSVTARLSSAETGALLGTFVEDAPRADLLPEAVNRLAGRIAGALGVPDVAAAPDGGDAAGGTLFSSGDDDPLSVKSDELEAIMPEGGGRTLIFTRNVRVSQGDMQMRSQRLEAYYPAGSQDPEKLVATGSVRMVQQIAASERRELLCDRATYYESSARLHCVGGAELRQGNDRVRGREIEIDLDDDTLRVVGGVELDVRSESNE